MRARCAVRSARGFTLIEVIVVVTVLGVILGVTGLALGSLQTPRESQLTMNLKKARTEAIQSGTPRTAHGVRFLPDGRAIGPDVDPLTGIHRAR
jgi:prepilin-type N-terminal cleavage/methylation domain-containing protein